jgi:hypothetical protein
MSVETTMTTTPPVITDTEEEHTKQSTNHVTYVLHGTTNKGARNLCYQLVLTNCYCDVPSGCCVRHVVAISSIDVSGSASKMDDQATMLDLISGTGNSMEINYYP